MLSKIFRPTKISSSTTIISLATLFSYVFGLIRDRIVSTTFGATVETDAFNAAFLLPDMLVNIFITSALSAAFLPVFTDYLKKNDSKADKLATQILTIFTFFIGICSILIALNLKWIVPSLYKDFPLEGQLLITELTKMALVSGLIFAISNTIGNILMSKKHFLSYALSPIFYNIGIILGVLFFESSIGIYSAVLGAIIGATFHLAIRLIDLTKTKFTLTFSNKLEVDGLKKIIKLSFPRAISTMSWEVNRVITSIVGTQLVIGGFTAFNYARNIQSFAVSIFGISFATAIFPYLAESASSQNNSEYSRNFQQTIQRILFFTIPASAGLILTGSGVISIIFGGGQFDKNAIQLTSIILTFFAISIPFESVMHILARAFYAKKNTLTPMIINLISMIFMGCLTLFVAPKYGISWLSISFTGGYILYTILASFFIRKELSQFNTTEFRKKLLKIFAATAIMSITIFLIKSLNLSSIAKSTILEIFIGSIVFFYSAYALKIDEVRSISVILKKFIK